MRRQDFLRVVAHLSEPLAGDAPMLDSLVTLQMARVLGMNASFSRSDPIPDLPPTPVAHKTVGEWTIPRASSPILSEVRSERSEHFNTRFDASRADDLEERERLVLNTTGGATKSYRLPLRVRVVDRVAWFVVCNRRDLLLKVRKIEAIGKKTSIGYGRVAKWEFDRVDEDFSWYAPSEAGSVLMRPLPLGPWIRGDVIGYRRAFHAVSYPYWHPDSHCEAIVPC